MQQYYMLVHTEIGLDSTKNTTKKQRQEDRKFRKGQDTMVTPPHL